MKCEITRESADEVTVSVLQDTKSGLEIDLRTKGKVFDTNLKKDAKIIKEHIKAINLILKYFGK